MHKIFSYSSSYPEIFRYFENLGEMNFLLKTQNISNFCWIHNTGRHEFCVWVPIACISLMTGKIIFCQNLLGRGGGRTIDMNFIKKEQNNFFSSRLIENFTANWMEQTANLYLSWKKSHILNFPKFGEKISVSCTFSSKKWHF